MSSFVNGALDSSPIALPPKKQPTLDQVASRPQSQLKRSASTASLTLPTPKTERRKTKQRVKSPTPDCSDDDEAENSRTTGSGKLDFTTVDVEESSDDDMWYHSSDDAPGFGKSKLQLVKDSVARPITPPVSRGPSNASPGRRRNRVQDDDLENPFLETPAGKVRPKRHSTADDFPTIMDANGEPQFNHYVYKGKRVTFLNPLFNKPLRRREQLPLTHPDYSPPRNVRPCNLFPKEIYGRAARAKAAEAEEDYDDDDDNPFLAAVSTKPTKARRSR